MRDMWKLVGIVVFSIAFGMILTVLIQQACQPDCGNYPAAGKL